MKTINIRDEISIHDNDKLGNEGDESDNTVEDEGPSNQLFYDVLDELEDYDMPDPTTIQLRDRKKIDIPNMFPTVQKRHRRTRQTHTKGQRQIREYRSKPHYLMMVDAKDCMKNKISGCYLTQETKTQGNVETKQPQNKKKQKEGSQQSTK